jgi:hypothetical protein
VSGYKIKLSSPSAPARMALAVAFPTETSISGLVADTAYVATICAINLHGLSEFSVDSQPAKTRRGAIECGLLSFVLSSNEYFLLCCYEYSQAISASTLCNRMRSYRDHRDVGVSR